MALAEIKNTEHSTVWKLLSEIPDPEIPVISIVELGIIRNIETKEGKVIISITPTYSGCPAMQVIEKDIVDKLKEQEVDAEIVTVYAPAWTTDWIDEAAKEKLRRYGIAPPEKSSSDKNALLLHPKKIRCPRCHSENSELISQFGSTPCKALYRCLDCKEPFDYFKCH